MPMPAAFLKGKKGKKTEKPEVGKKPIYDFSKAKGGAKKQADALKMAEPFKKSDKKKK